MKIHPVKDCAKTNANLCLLTCKLSQGSKILSDCKNNKVIWFTSGYIMLDCQIKTCNDWVAIVEFLQETSPYGLS